MSSDDRSTGRVVVLVLPEVNLLDLGGPVQVFDIAVHQGAGYRLEFVAAEPGEVASAQGLRLAGLGPLPALHPGDLVLVPGPRLRPPTPQRPLVPPQVIPWLRAGARDGARIASVCTGAAALAEAGLLCPSPPPATAAAGVVVAMGESFSRSSADRDRIPTETASGAH